MDRSLLVSLFVFDLLSFFLLQERNCRRHLGVNLGHFAPNQIDVLINDGLVGLVHFWQWKQGDGSQNDEGETIEPSSNVRQEVQKEPKLERVHKVVNQKESSEAEETRVRIVENRIAQFRGFVWGERDVQIQVFLEGVALSGLLNGLKHGFVHSEGEGAWKNGEGRVSHDTDEWQAAQGDQNDEDGAEHGTRLLGVPPVHELTHALFIEAPASTHDEWMN